MKSISRPAALGALLFALFTSNAEPALTIVQAPPDTDIYLASLAHGGTLYRWRRGAGTWTAAADLVALGLHGVTRLAVSPSGDRITIVAQPRNPAARQASARARMQGISLALDHPSEEASNGFAREVLVRHPAGEG